MPPIDEEVEFRLKRISFPASELCEPFGPSAGFELVQIAISENQTTRTLHKDGAVPASRNCPLDYDFADLVTYYPENGAPVAALIILMTKVGFEGPDGRYLAVTTKLD